MNKKEKIARISYIREAISDLQLDMRAIANCCNQDDFHVVARRKNNIKELERFRAEIASLSKGIPKKNLK